MKKVLITGILGQDGANMAEYLATKDDDRLEVYGMMRRTSISQESKSIKIFTLSKGT